MANPIWQISLQMEIAKENINNNAKFHKCNKEVKQASPKFLGTWNSYCAQLWTQKELPMTLWRSWQESCSSGTNSLLRALLFFWILWETDQSLFSSIPTPKGNVVVENLSPHDFFPHTHPNSFWLLVSMVPGKKNGLVERKKASSSWMNDLK